jgi:hypothetical protein
MDPEPLCFLCRDALGYEVDAEKFRNAAILGCTRCSLIRSIFHAITSNEDIAQDKRYRKVKLVTGDSGLYSCLSLETPDGDRYYDLLESSTSQGLLVELLGESWSGYAFQTACIHHDML